MLRDCYLSESQFYIIYYVSILKSTNHKTSLLAR